MFRRRFRLKSSGNHSDQQESQLYKQMRPWNDGEIEMDVKRSEFDRLRRRSHCGDFVLSASVPEVLPQSSGEHTVLHATTATGDIPFIKSAGSLMTGNNPMKYRRMLT